MKMDTVDCALVFHARCGCTFLNSARVRVGGSIFVDFLTPLWAYK